MSQTKDELGFQSITDVEPLVGLKEPGGGGGGRGVFGFISCVWTNGQEGQFLGLITWFWHYGIEDWELTYWFFPTPLGCEEIVRVASWTKALRVFGKSK